MKALSILVGVLLWGLSLAPSTAGAQGPAWSLWLYSDTGDAATATRHHYGPMATILACEQAQARNAEREYESHRRNMRERGMSVTRESYGIRIDLLGGGRTITQYHCKRYGDDPREFPGQRVMGLPSTGR